MPVNPNSNKRGGTLKVILRSEIEEAQRHTNSNAAAARWLNVGYLTYRKYAKLYGLFDQHTNAIGVGIEKGFAKNPTNIPLREILNNQHPDYSPAKLKNRLIARKKLVEECSLCGFNEGRITDGKVPLMLNFIDGNKDNMALSNLNLLCYNCMFLTTGAPSVVNKKKIQTSLAAPEELKKHNIQPSITSTDYIDLDEDTLLEQLHNLEDMELTEEEMDFLRTHHS